MQALPDEVILQIISILTVPDIISLQAVSRRFLALARDTTIWKSECFEASLAGSLERQQQLLDQQRQNIAELRDAIAALPTSSTLSTASENLNLRAIRHRIQRVRALANWDPGYPDERLDYYQEFIHRHAPINVGWFDIPRSGAVNQDDFREATGLGALYGDHGHLRHAIAPLDDGSICIWDVAARTTNDSGPRGSLLSQSKLGLLSGRTPSALNESHTIMTETGAVECVSVDKQGHRAYFAVQSRLHEVDLNTLQLISSKEYPWPITALSKSQERVPLAVGTNWTVHLHDARDHVVPVASSYSTIELISGSPRSHVALTQPGPLSIVYDDSSGQESSSIWVGGRFTSLLNYDLRHFPRLRGTIHSGARIASLSSIPCPYVSRSLDLLQNPQVSLTSHYAARAAPGVTLIAAAEYKGKGSLELYGLPGATNLYKNRQTISASKLLSVAPHEGRVVISDGDGNLKWMERNGVTAARTFNVNDAIPKSPESTSGDSSQQRPSHLDPRRYVSLLSTTPDDTSSGDIVQKMIPTSLPISVGSPSSNTTSRHDINQSNLLLWTGDGRLGILGFGRSGTNPLSAGADDEVDDWHEAPEEIEQRAREDAERQYGMAMRRALERNADEVRFVRGLGMGFSRP